MRSIDIYRKTQTLVSIANLLGVRAFAIIVPEESNISSAHEAVCNYYMRETLLGGDGVSFLKTKGWTDVYIYSLNSWKDVLVSEINDFDMIYRLHERW